MDKLKEEFKLWKRYAEDDTGEEDFTAVRAVELSVRTHQSTINSITHKPANLPAHVVPARIVALLLTALEAIVIHIENLSFDRADDGSNDDFDQFASGKRILDQKALIRGYLRRLEPFIFADPTPAAPEPPSDA